MSTTIYWPSSLPQRPLQDGLNDEFPDNRIVFKTDAGAPIIRSKGTTAPYKISLSMHMTKTQYLAFKTFFNETTGGGIEVFYFPDWNASSDESTVYNEARFDPESSMPRATPNGPEYDVSFTLEVWE
ncbi:MAG: hypothetical protein ABFD50_09140 [Smithella sp.]|jgi:hypothetical protein